jgi:hypothetical protein
MPDCAHPEQTPYTHDDAWCGGHSPQGQELTRLQNSLARIRQRGVQCAALAAKAQTLLDAGTFRLSDTNYPGWAAGAPLGGNWAIFRSEWLTSAYSEKNLDWVISHEMDHSTNAVIPGVTDAGGHLLLPDGSVDPYNTPNSRVCGGV